MMVSWEMGYHQALCHLDVSDAMDPEKNWQGKQ
jgi:hypothetical protein